jgi:hypothetical protein
MTDTQHPAGPPRRHDETDGSDQPARQPAIGDSDLATLAGVAAVVFPLVYFASELVEVAQGNFSTARLALAYIGEAGIAFAVIGLYAVQRPRVGRLGLYGALAYAYAFAFFASTVVYALAAGSKNWAAVTRRLRRLAHAARRHHGHRRHRVRPGRHQDRGPAPLDRGVPDGRGRARGRRGGHVHRGSCRCRCPAAGSLHRHGRHGAAGTLAKPEAACNPRAIASAQPRTRRGRSGHLPPAAASRQASTQLKRLEPD